MGRILTRATLRGTLTQIHHVSPVHPRDANGPVAQVYQQMQRDFGMLAPPIVLHSPSPGVLAAAWVMLRETLLAPSFLARAAKEVVATEVSRNNSCPYCVEIHDTTFQGLVRPRVAAADPTLRAVADWARSSGTEATAHPVPLPAGEAAEALGVAVTFQYLNRMVNLFLDPSPLPARLPSAAHAPVRRVGGWLLAPTARRVRDPGLSLSLLPSGTLPDELAWAAPYPRLADTFARVASAYDEASVPPAVRATVHMRLSTWDGTAPVLDTGWVDEAVAGLPGTDRLAGRLALLTALASYRVTPALLDGYRREAGDAALIELTSWASFAAARRIGAWLPSHRKALPCWSGPSASPRTARPTTEGASHGT
jgi:hypothetical protein